MPISLCMVVRNEGDCIGNALHSARSIVDEILVIDQQSTDNTREVLDKYGATVITKRPKGFSDPDRNYLFNQARNEWILYLDGDEYLDEKLKKLIPEVVKMGCAAYWFRHKNLVNGKDIKHMLGDDWHPRLFRKGAITFTDRGHVYPQINTPIQGWIEKGHIVHERTLEKIKKSSQARINLQDEQSRKVESDFIQQLERFLAGTKSAKNNIHHTSVAVS